jgi:hypothetical protein
MVSGTIKRQNEHFARMEFLKAGVSKAYGFETPCSRLIHKRIQGGTINNFIDTAPCKHNKSSED